MIKIVIVHVVIDVKIDITRPKILTVIIHVGKNVKIESMFVIWNVFLVLIDIYLLLEQKRKIAIEILYDVGKNVRILKE
jgi:hypothetical protein